MTLNLLRLRLWKFFWRIKHWFNNLFATKKPEQPKSITYSTDALLPKASKYGMSDTTRSGLKKHPLHNMSFGNFRPQRPLTTKGRKTLFTWEKSAVEKFLSR